MVKRVVRKKSVKKRPDVDIKIRNLDKVINAKRKGRIICGTRGGGCNCWIFGSALAMILSYTQNSSILYAILHGILSWFYVLFRAMQIWGWF